MQAEKITRENVEMFVRQFYAKVFVDETVGPFFIEKLGDDMESEHWVEHLDIIVGFWIAIAFGTPKYTRQLFTPHTKLGDVKRETFEQWLHLFSETLDEVYVPAIAAKFNERANIIAGNFMRNLQL